MHDEMLHRVAEMERQISALTSYLESMKLLLEDHKKQSEHERTKWLLGQHAGSNHRKMPTRGHPGWSIEACQEFGLLNEIRDVVKYLEFLQGQADGELTQRLKVALVALQHAASLQDKYFAGRAL